MNGELTQVNGGIATISSMTRSINSDNPAYMDEEREPGKTEQEYAEEINAAVTKGRDIALQAHLVFVTEHTTSTEFMPHADKLNEVLAELNKMIDKPQE
jgi:hypothetical protein